MTGLQHRILPLIILIVIVCLFENPYKRYLIKLLDHIDCYLFWTAK